MAFLDAVKYDALYPLTSSYEFGETVTYTDSAISPTTHELRVTFGREELEERSDGGIADVVRVFAPEAPLVATPVRKGTLTRGAVVWVIQELEKVDGGYVLYCDKGYRPAPSAVL